jgi:hypothetical protein
MALVGNQNQNQGNVGAGVPATPAKQNDDEFKAGKKAAAERHAAKVKEERQKDYERMLAIRDELKANGGFDKLSKENQEYVLAKCVPPSERASHTGPSFFSQVFGENAQAGKVVTLKEVITKTYKGMDTLASYIKKWAAKGIEVKVEVNKADMLETKYTLVKVA